MPEVLRATMSTLVLQWEWADAADLAIACLTTAAVEAP
jgi:hypothetical protein